MTAVYRANDTSCSSEEQSTSPIGHRTASTDSTDTQALAAPEAENKSKSKHVRKYGGNVNNGCVCGGEMNIIE